MFVIRWLLCEGGYFLFKIRCLYLGIKVRLVFARMDSMVSRDNKKFQDSFCFAFLILCFYVASVDTSNGCS